MLSTMQSLSSMHRIPPSCTFATSKIVWRIRATAHVLLLTLLTSWLCSQCYGLQGESLIRSRSRTASTVDPRCFGRQPPRSAFDLDAIESFERYLDAQVAESAAIDEELNDVVEMDEIGTNNVDVRAFPLDDKHSGLRIDAFLAIVEPTWSRSYCGRLVDQSCVATLERSSGEESVINRKSFKVSDEAAILVRVPPPSQPETIVAQKLPLDILFEDDHIIVLNKAAGMVTHPAAGNWDGTVVNALAYHFQHHSSLGKSEFVHDYDVADGTDDTKGCLTNNETRQDFSWRPGIVHRLDKGTTGVLVVAKTEKALQKLSDDFARRRVRKTYLAITVGQLGGSGTENVVTIDKPIGRHPIHRQKMRVVPTLRHAQTSAGLSPSQAGRRAISFVQTLATNGKLSLVQVRIETGRTHQIRVHLQNAHAPIYGDDVYGMVDCNKNLAKTYHIVRPLLHAHRLEFLHPVTNQALRFEAPMPNDMKRIADSIQPAETSSTE